MNRWTWLLIAGALAALLWAAGRHQNVESPSSAAGLPAFDCRLPGPLPASELEPPLQGQVPEGVGEFRLGAYHVRPLAGFSLQARVLGREDYRFDRGADLSPTDLALGWGRMADPAHYSRLDLWQSNRWYRYRWGNEGPPLPEDEIARSSANMHLVPANGAVASTLSRVEPDQLVRLRGWLVEVRGEDGSVWRSSLSRNDTGDGACELIYVCEMSAE